MRLLEAEVGQWLSFTAVIASSNSLQLFLMIKLTVPWEAAEKKAYEHKKLMYAELAVDAKVHPVELGCTATSTSNLLWDVGVHEKVYWHMGKNLLKAHCV